MTHLSNRASGAKLKMDIRNLFSLLILFFSLSANSYALFPPNKNPLSRNTIAFITNFYPNTVFACRVKSTGELVDCKDAFMGSSPITYPYGIRINNQFAYISDKRTGQLFYCQIANQTQLVNCKQTLQGVREALQLFSLSNNTLYLTSLYGDGKLNGYISACPIDKDGSVNQSQCVTNYSEDHAYAYAIPYQNKLFYHANTAIYYCDSIKEKSISDCGHDTGYTNPARHDIPYGLVFNDRYLYISVLTSTHHSQAISSCYLDNGSLANCVPQTGVPLTTSPMGIEIRNGFLYLTGFFNNKNEIYVCPILPNGGAGVCKPTAYVIKVQFSSSVDLDFYSY